MNRSFWVILVSFCSQVMRRPCRPWTMKKCIFSMARPASRWDRENNGRAGCATGNGLLSSSRWPRVAIRGQREKGGEGAEGPQQSHQAPSGTLGPPRSAIRGERSSPLQLAAPFVGRLDGVGGGGEKEALHISSRGFRGRPEETSDVVSLGYQEGRRKGPAHAPPFLRGLGCPARTTF